VRGLVMVIMVLDHVRDYLAGSIVNPRDVTQPVLFLTRWITHLCAPTFVLLAGVSAYLYGRRGGKGRAALARFLVTRGLWLVILELTVLRVGFTFSLFPDFLFLQVIWVIGWGMVLLAGLVYLPRWAIAAFALLLVFGHNALDGVRDAGPAWSLLHEPAILPLSPRISVFALYPLLPWVGVLAAGYALGPLFTLPAPARARRLVALGLGAIALFVALRAAGVHGDPAPYVAQDGALASLLAFVNCEKYPPSLLFLLMTLGPALLLVAAAERARGALARALTTFGRVPTFFYVTHIYVIHLVAVVYALAADGDAGWLFGGLPPMNKPEGFGVSLGVVYLVWPAVVAALYLPSRWFAALKQRRRDWWLSYL
jgi:uncharacterized membrane protein